MLIEDEVERIQEFVERENFHAAINIAISALNECRRNNNQEGCRYFIQVIKDIVISMEKLYLP